MLQQAHGRLQTVSYRLPVLSRGPAAMSRRNFPKIWTRPFSKYYVSNQHDERLIFGLMGMNVAVFVMWKTMNRFFMFQHFTASPEGIIRHHRWHTLLTCTFSHTNIWHLLVNMLGLYFFGGTMLAYTGARQFLALYLSSGIVSSAAQVFMSYKERRRTVLLGASGAVNCCVAFNILAEPRRIVLLYGLIPVPLALLGVFIMFQDVTGAMDGGPAIAGSTNVGYVSHLVGAGIGAAFFLATRGMPRF